MSPSSNRLLNLRLPLRSARLELTLPTSANSGDLPSAISDPRVAGWLLHLPDPYTRKDARAWARAAAARFREGTALQLLIFERGSGKLVGGIGLRQISWEHRSAELGYWLAVGAWGRGYGTEAARLVVRTSFQRLGLHRLEAGTFDGNRRSQHVLRKLGFRKEGIRRKTFWVRGRWRDDVVFGLIRKAPIVQR